LGGIYKRRILSNAEAQHVQDPLAKGKKAG